MVRRYISVVSTRSFTLRPPRGSSPVTSPGVSGRPAGSHPDYRRITVRGGERLFAVADGLGGVDSVVTNAPGDDGGGAPGQPRQTVGRTSWPGSGPQRRPRGCGACAEWITGIPRTTR